MNSTPNDEAHATTEVVSDTGRFAIVPEWVEEADISDRAVRLYARLALWADRSSGETNPYHATLAKALKTSESSVKRALQELKGIGAVSWVPRFVGDVQVANVYTVRRVNPRGVASGPPGVQKVGGGSTGEPRGVQGGSEPGVTGDLQDPEGTTPRGKEPEIVVSDDVRRLADLLAELMVANGCRRPTITKSGFLDPIRLLIEKDGVTADRVEAAIRWSQGDEFWRANIHSGRALREKFDTLRQQAARQRRGSPTQVKDAASEYLARKASA